MATLSHASFFLHFFLLPTAITLVLYEPQMLLALLWHYVNCLLAWKTVSVSQDRCQ